MSALKKFFLSNVVQGGIVLGVFAAIYSSPGYGREYGITLGIIECGLIILLGIFISFKESTKPTFPVNVPSNEIPIPTIKLEFRARDFIPVEQIVLFGAVFILLPILMLITATLSYEILRAKLLLTLTVFIFLLSLIMIMRKRLVLEAEGLEVVSIFYKQRIAWNDVEQIEEHRKVWFIICRKSTIHAQPLIKVWQGGAGRIRLFHFMNTALISWEALWRTRSSNMGGR